jgi:hypothetical protein
MTSWSAVVSCGTGHFHGLARCPRPAGGRAGQGPGHTGRGQAPPARARAGLGRGPQPALPAAGGRAVRLRGHPRVPRAPGCRTRGGRPGVAPPAARGGAEPLEPGGLPRRWGPQAHRPLLAQARDLSLPALRALATGAAGSRLAEFRWASSLFPDGLGGGRSPGAPRRRGRGRREAQAVTGLAAGRGRSEVSPPPVWLCTQGWRAPRASAQPGGPPCGSSMARKGVAIEVRKA